MLVGVLGLTLVLGTWGNRWGAPAHWHGDEMYLHARRLVEERTLNTHKYSYGLLNYYTVALLGIAPIRLYDRAFDPRPRNAGALADSMWTRREQVRGLRASRTVSAVEAMLLVAVVWWIGLLAFDDGTALLAAALLALNPVLVTMAHFATADTGGTLCYWAACGCTLRYLKAPNRRWLLAAGLAGGIAIGLKADRVTIAAPLVTAFLLARPRGRLRDLVESLLLLPAGFIIANPVLLTAPFEYVDGFVRELWYNALRTNQMDLGPILTHVQNALGWPLVLLVLVAGTYGVARLLRRGQWPAAAWFAAALLPYGYLLARTDKPWYALMVLPPLLLVAAFGSVEALRRIPARFAAAGWAGVAGLVVWSLYRAVMVDAQFVHEPRDVAARWITANVPPGALIEMVGYGPALPLARYQVRVPVRLELCDDAIAPLIRLDHTPLYRKFRTGLAAVERWASAHLGMQGRRQPYRAWFDAFAERCATPAPPDLREADYVVTVGEGRTKEIPPQQLSSHYRLRARFEYPYRGLSGPPLGFVNLPVNVYGRDVPDSR